jgi:CRP-like cAMP-binding protein
MASSTSTLRYEHPVSHLVVSAGRRVPHPSDPYRAVICGNSPRHDPSGGIEIDVTNQELAEAANIDPVTISRLISEWQKSGAVRKRRGKLLLTTNFPV